MESDRRNPYRPGHGLAPLYLAGRQHELTTARRVLRGAPEQPANIRLTGLRGIGKTVLLGEYERLAVELGWGVGALELEPRHNNEAALLGALRTLLDGVVARLSAVAGAKRRLHALRPTPKIEMELEGLKLGLSLGVTKSERDLLRALVDALQATTRSGRAGLLLLLDEAHAITDDAARNGEHPLSMLLAASGAMQRAGLPLGLVVAGLPTLTGNLLRARTYSERMFRGIELGPLGRADARAALLEPLIGSPLSVHPDLETSVYDDTRGYPYFVQLWGAELWEVAEENSLLWMDDDLLKRVRPGIYARLDQDFYRPRLEMLSKSERVVLSAAGRCLYPPLQVGELVRLSGRGRPYVSRALKRLVESGMVYRRRTGEYFYAVPEMHGFLLRQRVSRSVDDREGWELGS